MTESLEQARAAYLEKHRKHRDKRKARRSERRKDQRKPRPAPKTSPPPLDVTPRAWSEEQKAQWLERLIFAISEGGSVAGFCRDHPDAPHRSVFYQWIWADASLLDRYQRAREMSADTLAEDCVLIADSVRDAGQFDSARVNAARLAVDARKWVASKLKPKTYADRIETVQSGSLTVEHKLSDDDRAKVLAMIEARQIAGQAPNLIEAQRMIESRAKDITPKKDGP